MVDNVWNIVKFGFLQINKDGWCVCACVYEGIGLIKGGPYVLKNGFGKRAVFKNGLFIEF